MKAIILVGYMCVGKTTVGRSLAKELGCQFYDLDWYIEERFRKKVPLIFAEQGEEKFRDLERRMLHEVAEFENVVVSCGGGTPCFFDNMEYMNQVATTVYMKASVDTILEHLRLSKGERPLLTGNSTEDLRTFVTEQLAARTPFYEQAKYVTNVDVLNDFKRVNDVALTIKNLISN
jgi:shikimate kinase